MKVRDLMVEAVRVDKNDHISHAIDQMDKDGTSWAVVTRKGEPAGVLGYRDLGRELGSVKKMDLPSSALHVSTAMQKTDATLSPGDGVEDAVETMAEIDGGVLAVVEDGEIVGMLREEDLLGQVESNKKVAELLEETDALSPDDRLVHARELMLDGNSWRLPVVESGRLVGILTETDVAQAMKSFRDLVPGDQQDKRVRNILVEDVMSTDLTSVRTGDRLTDARDAMLEKGVGGLPVLDDDGDLAGVVTRTALVQLLR